MDRPIAIALLAMGGEGGGVVADWLVNLAEHEGWVPQSTSVPGVAQRTGATIYYIEIFPESVSAGREPVLALMPVPGEVDLVVASELMEAGRAVQRGLVSADRTTLVASTHRVYAVLEKIAMGDGRADERALFEGCQAAAQRFLHADFAKLSQGTGSPIGAALFGAIAASGRLPFSRQAFEAAIERAGVGVAASLRAFAAGFEAVRAQLTGPTEPVGKPSPRLQEPAAGSAQIVELQRNAPARPAPPPLASPSTPAATSLGPRLAALGERMREELPAAVHPTVERALVRLAEYQDEAYAALYLDRLAPFSAFAASAASAALSASPPVDSPGPVFSSEILRPAEPADPTPGAALAFLQALCRSLALWMSYEDTVRVADLKIRRARLSRIAVEAGVSGDEELQVQEFLHPRLQEIADVLPVGLARWLLASGWASRIVGRLTGKGRIIQTNSVRGFLLLYAVAGLRGLRRSSLRYAQESARIEEWLSQIQRALGAQGSVNSRQQPHHFRAASVNPQTGAKSPSDEAAIPKTTEPMAACVDWALATQIAECQNLVKGYGDTHARGLRNFEAVMRALATLNGRHDAAQTLQSLREAALSDESGEPLRKALAQLGIEVGAATAVGAAPAAAGTV
jgi:indolepyruvate ferredoxin oxidoreductase, beta subunit